MTTDEPTRRWLPWRSATAGWVIAALALLAGVPIFLCMPPWNDVTLHDMAVRSILRGGVHYRDVFDTNLPGIDWAMAGVRAAFGWSYEVLRAADLVVIALEVWLLIGWVRRAGGVGDTAAWLAAAAALFYPFTSEFNHVQRDPWLLLPALVAARLRLARVETASRDRKGALSVLEGLAWGAAVWVKPHVVIPAFLLWAVSAVLIARRESRRAVLIDLCGLVLGGLIVGAAGVAWLVGTGAWPYFLDVFLNWNPGYLSGVFWETGERFLYTFRCFRPWSLLHFAALPLALLALWEAGLFTRCGGLLQRIGRRLPRWMPHTFARLRKALLGPRLYAPSESEAVADGRALLAAFYLGWFAQAALLQKGFDYVQVPLLFLAMGVVATHRWAFGFAYLVWFALNALFLFTVFPVPPGDSGPGVPVLKVEQYPLTDPGVMKYWPRCWREGGSAELRDRLSQFPDVHCSTKWTQLEDVARFLRTVQPPLGPRELNCWHDTTHPLYLMLDLDPATRYMHYGTAFGIPGKADVIAEEVRKSPGRYVVADLGRMTWDRDQPQELGPGGERLALPRWFPVSQRDKFPWNQKLVFRSGRYVVYEVVKRPLGDIDIPDWFKLDELGPGLP